MISLLLVLPTVVGCNPGTPPDDKTADTTETAVPVVRTGSFAIITDTHIGEGSDDYGTAGWEDSGGEDDALTDALTAAVDAVNQNREKYDIHFVAALGDFSDSGEASELTRSRDLLDRLDVPWVPAIGNHDVWPYAYTVPGVWEEAAGPDGDRKMREIFADDLASLSTGLDGWEAAPMPVVDPSDGAERYLLNYAFQDAGFHFMVLDLNSRLPAPKGYPGIGPEADLFDFPGGTWPWVDSQMAALPSPSRLIVLAHHPIADISHFAFEADEMERVNASFAVPEGVDFPAQFAGHLHVDIESTDAIPGTTVVVTHASKDGAGIRVVQLYSDGTVDWETFIDE